jgi:cysteine desulfurase
VDPSTPSPAARAYLDHASTAPLRPEAVAALRDLLDLAGQLGDPGRLHVEGRTARDLLEQARNQVAAWLGVGSRQVVFTSSATEAIHAAVHGAATRAPGRPILLAPVEHSAVQRASARVAPTVALPVDRHGRVPPEAVAEALGRAGADGEQPAAALVHCQLVNHELGTLQPVAEVAQVCRRAGVLLHVDAAAAAGHLPIAFEELGADLLSVSGHKLGGPPGIGCLVLRRGLRLPPLLLGGDQERARRAGLENLLGAVGLGAAAAALGDRRAQQDEAARQRALVTALQQAALAGPGVQVLGEPDPDQRAPHLLCLGLEGVEAEPVLLALDQAGVACHSGSSCASEALAPSPVLAAIGVDADRSLRLSVGWSTTQDEVVAFTRAFGPALARLRALGSSLADPGGSAPGWRAEPPRAPGSPGPR